MAWQRFETRINSKIKPGKKASVFFIATGYKTIISPSGLTGVTRPFYRMGYTFMVCNI